MNEAQAVQLDILKKFSHVMAKERLTWFAMFGTLLGAWRQGGFIPWDDDIDVAVPRADYDRLRQLPELFDEPYFLQTPVNDPAAAPRFLRLRHGGTAAITKDFPNCYTPGGHMGIYIDIIPLDTVPDMTVAQKIQELASEINARMFASAALDESGFESQIVNKEIICEQKGGYRGFYGLFAELYEKTCSGFADGHYYAMPVLRGERGYRVYDKEWFRKSSEMTFEGLKIPVPEGWKETLIASYPNGLYEPDPKYRVPLKHNDAHIIDTRVTYREYKQRYTDMLRGIENKKVYIFGAGDSLRIWLERYSDGLDIVCAFDNDKAKWGREAYGIPVRNPAKLPEMLGEDSRLVIASMYHKEIGRQLTDMGIKDYFVFIDGWTYERE